MSEMINKICLVVLVLCFVTAGVQAQDTNELPDITLSTPDGDEINVQDYATNGKITVINFWATWCVPCRKELNNIAEIYPDWVEDYDMELIAVSTDDSRTASNVGPYVDGKGWEYEVLLDVNEELKRALNFQSVPATLVVNAEGDIIYEHTGYVEGDEYELEKIIFCSFNGMNDLKKDDEGNTDCDEAFNNKAAKDKPAKKKGKKAKKGEGEQVEFK